MLLWAMVLLDLLLLDLRDQSHNLLDRHLEHQNMGMGSATSTT